MNYYDEEEDVDVMDGFRLDDDEDMDDEDMEDDESSDDDSYDDPEDRFH